jgi:hypothetical protein
MSNVRPQGHHSLNGEELREAIFSRVKQGVLQAMTLRSMHAFPLVRYRVTIEVIPYSSQGSRDPVVDDKNVQKCVVEGREFLEVVEDAVELVHDSTIIGWDKDPQQERSDLGLGRLETKRVEGQYIDARVGATARIEEPELPPPSGRATRAPVVPPLAPDHKPVDVATGVLAGAKAVPLGASVNTAAVPLDEGDRILRQEAETWSAPSPDPLFHDAIASEEVLPGRVTKIKK